MIKVLVTGATGFVGTALLLALTKEEGYEPLAAIRKKQPGKSSSVQMVTVGDINANTNWEVALSNVQVVIHTAARAHTRTDARTESRDDYRDINVAGTLNLARQAIEHGVGRMIFVSSVKVNGEATDEGHPYTENDLPQPADFYGISKLEAEQGLLKLAEGSSMEVVVIRPPLIYGPGVKANFYSMMRWLDKGIPLPLGAIRNKRSLVGLDNLVDFVVTCVNHPGAANETFLVCDGEDLSTTDLLDRLAKAMGKRARLIPVPKGVLRFCAALLNRTNIARRICGSLQVDNSKANELLGWTAPVTVDEGLRKTAKSYLISSRK